MNDIFEEVVREHVYEKKVKYFKQILPITVILTLLTVIGMLIFGWYQDKRKDRDIEMTSALLNTLMIEKEDLTTQIAELDYIIEQKDNSRIKEVAILAKASLQVNNNNFMHAKKLFKTLIDTEGLSENTACFARLGWIALSLDETMNPNEEAEFLEYASYFDENKPFFGTVSIMKSIWLLQNHKDNTEVITILNKVCESSKVPKAVKEQAIALLENIENNNTTSKTN